jgi:uncharacterized membrane protein (UPF0127 family)
MKLSGVFAGTVLAAFLVLGVKSVAVSATAGEVSEYGNPLIPVSIKGVTVTVEAVASPEKLYLGLSYRQALPAGRGMLFIMPFEEIQEFCMRGMRFAIDIIWIGEGRVVGCEKNVSPGDPRILASPTPVKYVLEVPAGFCERHNIAAHDRALFRWP